MIKHLLSFAAFCLLGTQVFSQDIITKKSGEGVKAKVVEITPTEIKFKRYENLDGPVYTLLKSDVLLVKYENNTEEVFAGTESYTRPEDNAVATVSTTPDVTPAATPAIPAASAQDLYLKGQQDADIHYKGYKSAGTGVLVGSLLISPLLGLVPAVVCSTAKPRQHNLNYPNYTLMQDVSYSSGYTNRARKIKSRKVWRNWGIAFGVNLALAVALSQ